MAVNHYNITSQEISTESLSFSSKTKNYNVISLFSGAGGMDLGFVGDFEYLNTHYDKNPFNILFSNDNSPQATAIYNANFNHNSLCADIEQLSSEDITKSILANLNYKSELPEIDLVLGGFPCQTFSYAGKRKGLSDPRGQLYLQMLRVISNYKPKMFIAENVDGIRNSRKNVDGEEVNHSALDRILFDFEDAGYFVQYRVLNSADYGVPQTRRRVIIIGIRKDLGTIDDITYPKPLFGLNPNRPWRTAKEGIDDLWDLVNNPSIPNHTSRDISKAKFYPDKKLQGNNKISADKPSPTIRAEHHGNIEAHYRSLPGYEHDNMEGWRRLSVRECARIQSFPDTFIFTASASAAYKAIGNAVPPVMAWHIARNAAHILQRIS